MPLSPQEKVQIRDHLAYLGVAELSTYVLGLPAGVETQFLIEAAMSTYVLEDTLPLIRQILCALDDVENQRKQLRSALVVGKVGGIEMRDPSEANKFLNDEYFRLVGRLSNAFGVPRNPFDHRGGKFGIPVC